MQYEIKRSFEPVIISGFELKGITEITVISDKLQPANAQLEMQLCNFSGKVLNSKKLNVIINANSPTKVFADSTQLITKNLCGNYLLINLKMKDGVNIQKIHYFTQPKNLQLSKSAVSAIVEGADNKWIITLNSDVLTKDLYLNFEGVEGFFNDNYFDLLPGATRKITFSTKNKTNKLPKLSLMSLVDSY